MLEESKRIKTAIESSGLSYMELEKITGISHSTLQRYAVGKTNRLPLSAVEKLANAIGVSAAWIVGWDNLHLPLSDHEHKVITAYRGKPLIQPAVDKLLDVEPEKETAPSNDDAVLSVAARGTPVADEQFDKLVSAEDTLERSTD